jgi:hypothetical protein
MMNERIKELAVQATSYADTLDVADQRIYQEIRDREFAELIVRECLDIAQDRANFPGFPPNDVNDIIDEIREHFGVE